MLVSLLIVRTLSCASWGEIEIMLCLSLVILVTLRRESTNGVSSQSHTIIYFLSSYMFNVKTIFKQTMLMQNITQKDMKTLWEPFS